METELDATVSLVRRQPLTDRDFGGRRPKVGKARMSAEAHISVSCSSQDRSVIHHSRGLVTTRTTALIACYTRYSNHLAFP
jgi:hypothetical protein